MIYVFVFSEGLFLQEASNRDEAHARLTERGLVLREEVTSVTSGSVIRVSGPVLVVDNEESLLAEAKSRSH